MGKSRSTTPPLRAISKFCRRPLAENKAFILTSISKQSSTLITIFRNTMQVVLWECPQLKIWHTYGTVIHPSTIIMGKCPSWTQRHLLSKTLEALEWLCPELLVQIRDTLDHNTFSLRKVGERCYVETPTGQNVHSDPTVSSEYVVGWLW